MTRKILDPRVNAVRADLAGEYLRGRVEAPRFSKGELRQVVACCAPLRRGAGHEFVLDSELLFGERVTVFESLDGWAWCQSCRDDYVGYVPASALGPGGPDATHRVSALCSHIYPEPDIKSPPLGALKMNARVAVGEKVDRFAELYDRGGFVFSGHLSGIGVTGDDFVAVAEMFPGVPYLWGGRSNDGLDCSALVQLALHATGKPCPRDSDLQESSLGRSIEVKIGLTDLERGDLLFWQGHVGIMLDGETLLHATAHTMMVVSELLRPAIQRIENSGGGEISAIRRL